MPKKAPPPPKKKSFSLEILEGDVIKITGVVLTIFVATQIVFIKGSHLIKEMRADVLGSHETAEISEEVVVEQEQNDSDLYKKIVEGSKSIVVKWNSDGVISYMNPFGAEFFGYTPDEIIGKSIFLLVPGVESTTKRDLNQLLREIQKDPEQFRTGANENIKKGGERVWINWTNSAIYGDGENEILSVGNERDCEEAETENPDVSQ